MGKSMGVGALMGIYLFLTGCQSNAPEPLYNRLGGDVMVSAVVEDFVGRAMSDPRVNFTRKGTPGEWIPTVDNVDQVKLRMAEYIEMASGAPQKYHGRDMRSVHANMEITDAQFSAMEADLEKSLEKFDEPAKESSELIALVEATRKDIVTVK